jgi:flagellar biosynthetic protein FliO
MNSAMNNFYAMKRWWAGLSKQKRTQVILIGFGILATLILAATAGGSGAPDDPLSAGPMFYVGVAVKLAGILLLIVGTAVLLRRWQSGRGAGRADRQVRLLETVRLSPKQALHLVRAGDRQLLIGATDSGITLLTSLEPDGDELEGPAPALDFNAVFALQNRPSEVSSQTTQER